MLKISAIFLGILLVLLTAFHFWFKQYARTLIEDLVESRSNGKLKMKVNKFKFNYFSKKMALEEAVFYNTDTINEITSYKFNVKNIKLTVKGFFPIIFQKQILIDSLALISPDIQVTRLKNAPKKENEIKKDISLPEEMGNVYNSIQDALNVLTVTKFRIEDGRFTLINKIDPDQQPVTIGNIDFHIDNILVDNSDKKSKQKILFSDNVVLHSYNQDITFPDGRHSLSFSKFRINLKKKIVEFDSCTIAAVRTDSSASSFNVFFDALQLININFDTLYRTEVIMADSVYCVNPKFNLVAEVEKKKNPLKAPPKLENIIKQLTGDLLLNYVVVSNADFNIKVIKDDVPTSFTFTDNNFEMQGLSVDQGAAKPVKVKSFAMAIRNYENFIKDSSYSVQFDSVLFRDNRIYLSNFIFTKLDDGKNQNTFSIPQFYLGGLSWDDLVFERKLKAEQANMFNPTISYTVSNKQKRQGQRNIFQSLATINDYFDLDYLDIIDGNIDLKIKKDLQILLSKATISVQSHSLLNSTKVAGLKKSLTNLRFENGTIRAGALTMELKNIHYIGNSGQFDAEKFLITDKSNKIKMEMRDVAVEKMEVNELTGDIRAEGIHWKKADININKVFKSSGKTGSVIELKKLSGTNTAIHSKYGSATFATTVNNISLNELISKPGQTIILNGLVIEGNQLAFNNSSTHLTVDNYKVQDNKNSAFNQVIFKTNTDKLKAIVSIPSTTMIPHIQPLLNGSFAIDAIHLFKPVINLEQNAVPVSDSLKITAFAKMDISGIKLVQPAINWKSTKDSSLTTLQWNGENNAANFLELTGLHLKEGNNLDLTLQNTGFYLTDFTFINAKGKTYQTGEGKIAATLRNIKLSQLDTQALQWGGIITMFNAKNFKLDSIGKTNGTIVMEHAELNELNLNNEILKNMQDLAAANPSFQLKNFTGQFTDNIKKLQWFNATFNRNQNTFLLDSFSYKPALEIDSFLAGKKYQTDYLTIKTGAAKIGPIDINRFIKDTTLIIGTSYINNLVFTDYKDKQLPFNAGIIKPLTADLIKNIPQRLSVDTFLLKNGFIEYTEVNEKTKEAGIIPITRMDVKILNLKNYNFQPADSLDILATGYLLDTAWIRLHVKESYTDSLGGFLMTLQLKPADLTILNPVLIPLASAKLASGRLDTLSMRAIGRDYLAMGEMDMYYHDLKIKVLDKDDGSEKKLLSFLVNLVVKNKNTSRTGTAFYIRHRDRSAINYLIKIALSGVTSSVGVKSNKKKVRKYKKDLINRNLPPMDLD